MAYYCIHTTVGRQLLAQAEATGTQVRLTHMAVGDGNGNATTPVETQTKLVRERFRATVNRVYQDTNNPLMFVAELIIPASAAGFTLREIGIFDSNGNLFVVGNLPATYKPNGSEGSYSDTVVRVPFMVTNASNVELKIDPNVVIATQSWIINNINPALLFPGGTVGQILRKKTNADGDTEWADLTDVNIVSNTIEEHQTLAASQTAVTWSTLTNTGLAVYIEGVRLDLIAGADGWQPNGTTAITLGKSYPAGTKITGVQNEPLGNVPFPLEASKNLSDVPNKAQGRTNLGVYSKAESDAAGQPGDIKITARISAPPGWLKANGAAVSRTTYAALFAAIGTTYGSGDGFNTFNLPDLRGEFVRGWDDGRGVDSGRNFGSRQLDEIKEHSHLSPTFGGGSGNYQVGSQNKKSYDYVDAAPTEKTGGTETRPRNVALLYVIKT